MNENLNRFLRYVKIDTQSDDTSPTSPSTAKQLNLTRLLQDELKQLGIESTITEHGVLYAKVPGEPGLPTIGLNSHVDTALECSGKDVKPQVIENYDGGDIVLGHGYTLSPKQFPRLSKYKGQSLVTTSGDTLLGADDKAGIAIIMSVLAYLKDHPEIKHHPLAICFTPDEEIGRGPDHFDAVTFGADFAYTVDGALPDDIAIETFNAAHAEVIVHGKAIHPGSAKGQLVNAQTVAFAFDRALPEKARPEFTEGHEGFNHLVGMEGNVEEAHLHYIIRNHDRAKLEAQKQDFLNAKKSVESAYPGAKIDVNLGDDYRNMKEILDQKPEAIIQAKKAFARLGIEPTSYPIRGGTDGATFSFKGCPTPNLGTGSYNHHGRYEFLSVSEFELMIRIVTEIVKA